MLTNQDKRALYDRWRQSGDLAQFRGIHLVNDATSPITSRFVQRNNYLVSNSINVGWRSGEVDWLKRLGVHELSINAITNEIFRFSSSFFERGTDYPFQRTATFNLNLHF